MSLLTHNCIDFIKSGLEKTDVIEELVQMVSDPPAFATRNDTNSGLSAVVERQLGLVQNRREMLNLQADDPVNKEVISFFNKVVIDGRYITDVFLTPKEVAEKLNLPIDNRVINRILEIDMGDIIDLQDYPGSVDKIPILPLIIFIIIFMWPSSSAAERGGARFVLRPLIVDRSNLNKV